MLSKKSHLWVRYIYLGAWSVYPSEIMRLDFIVLSAIAR